jgi:hypothetical protein
MRFIHYLFLLVDMVAIVATLLCAGYMMGSDIPWLGVFILVFPVLFIKMMQLEIETYHILKQWEV